MERAFAEHAAEPIARSMVFGSLPRGMSTTKSLRDPPHLSALNGSNGLEAITARTREHARTAMPPDRSGRRLELLRCCEWEGRARGEETQFHLRAAVGCARGVAPD